MNKGGANRINPKNQNELWCNHCQCYHHFEMFYKQSASAVGRRARCAQYENARRGRIRKKDSNTKIIIPAIYIDNKESLEGVNRKTLNGFLKYFSFRKDYFWDLYGKRFDEVNARKVFYEITSLKFSEDWRLCRPND